LQPAKLCNRPYDRIYYIDPYSAPRRGKPVNREKIAYRIVIVDGSGASTVTHACETSLVIVEVLSLVGINEACAGESKTYLKEKPEDFFTGG